MSPKVDKKTAATAKSIAKTVFQKLKIEQIKNDIENFLNDDNFLSFKGFNAVSIMKHKDILAQMVHMYLYDKRCWSIAYSGGKDSSVAVDLSLKAILLVKHLYGVEKVYKTTYMMFSDTLMEMDPVIEGILKSIDNIEKYAKKYELKLEVKRVSPIVTHTFFSLLIGKGYMMPRRDNRWCTDRMKIKPQQKQILKIMNSNKEGFVAITGQRQDESADRANRMQQQTIDGSFKEHEFVNCNLYAPVEHMTSDGIWNYIYSHALDWIDENELGRVYAEASGDGGECKSLLEGFETGSTPGCGKSSRYGCWVCTLFEKDKTLNNLTKHYDYMKDMEEFRNWLVQYKQGEWNHNRDVYIHGQHRMKKYDRNNHRKGMQIPGGYNVFFRKEILIRLMELERKVLPFRGRHLISDEELSYIQQCWIEDGDIDMSVSKIAYDRNINIEPLYQRVLSSVELMIEKNYVNDVYYTEKWVNINGLKRSMTSHYYCQMAIQLEKRGKDSHLIMRRIKANKDDEISSSFISFIKTLPLETRQNYITTSQENYIRKEWKDDKIGFWTFMERVGSKEISIPQPLLFGYDGDYGGQFEARDELTRVGDITKCELISLEDKMRFFDDWQQ